MAATLDTVIIWQTIAGGHIIKEARDDLFNLPIIQEYEYDNKINPFKKTNLLNKPVLFYSDLETFQCLDVNNVTKLSYTPGLGPFITDTRSLYRANGLPFMAYATDRDTPAPDNSTIYYFVYTAL